MRPSSGHNFPIVWMKCLRRRLPYNSPADAFTETDIIEYLVDQLAKYKTLVGGYNIVDSIPKNPAGKILRRVLKERPMQEIMIESK